MVDPRELLRTDSNVREFSAPRNTRLFTENPIDCGITQLPCLNRLLPLEKFARLKVFATCLSIAALLQGITLTYFRSTAKIWGAHYHIPQEHIEWLIYTNEFFVGIFALAVAYWGNKIHRMSWLGGLTIYQAINSLVLIVPEAYRKGDYQQDDNTTIVDLNLCLLDKSALDQAETNVIAFVLIVIYQILVSMSSISVISHGITYLDDNTLKNHSPGYIGFVLAAREVGKQLGIYLSGIPILLKTNSVFISIAWILLAVASFFIGTILAMFPQTLPAIVSKRLSASIVDMVSNQTYTIPHRVIDSFAKTILRLIRNKVLMLNILCAVFLQSALINFDIFEKFFNQSRFGVSSRLESTIPLIVNLLKQPLVAISLIATGMIIAKARPHPKSMVKWNIAVLVLVLIIFASTAFFNCEQNIEDRNIYCSSACSCEHSEFQPVCIKNKTFFSPCWAGCKSYKNDSILSRIYTDCACGGHKFDIGNYDATEGSCSWESESNKFVCNLFWTLAQANSVFTSALLDTTLVTNLMINMRCILKRDKALALGVEATLVGLIPYLPVKQIYDAISRVFCIQKTHLGKCNYYSDKFAMFLAISTIVLIAVSLIVAIVLHFLIKDKHFARDDNDEDDDDESVYEMRDIEEDETDTRQNNTLVENNEQLDLRHDSLDAMENVGDDHDSVESIPGRVQFNVPK